MITVIALLLAGCAAQKTPDIVCKSPYIRHADSCCLDKNSNDICDEDEEEDVFFVTPDYSPSEDIPDMTEDYMQPVYEEPVYDEPVEEEPEYVGEKEEVGKVYTTYSVPEAKLVGWKAENEYMSIEFNSMTIDVISIEPKNRLDPDKEVWLREMTLTIVNKDYNYLNPVLYFSLGDEKDPIIIKETLLCDRSDDLLMENCKNALPIAESMQVKMHIDRKIPRLDLDKTFTFRFQNKRVDTEAQKLKIEKTYDILKIPGAKYI